jgi:hypothetical protein
MAQIESSRDGVIERNQRAGRDALLSALVPGLGQAMQRRFGAAVIQFGTVSAYVAGALSLGGRRSLLLALLWNAWSIIDAYRHDGD